MGLGDAINNLVNSLKGSGSGSTKQAGTVGGASSAQGNGGSLSSVGGAVEEAIGNQLANIDKEPESAKSIEEKANTALTELMDKLGLSGLEFDEKPKYQIVGDITPEPEIKLEPRNIEIKESKLQIIGDITPEPEYPELKYEGTEADDGGNTTSDTKSTAKSIEEYMTEGDFTRREASDYVKGEKEIKSRVDAAIEENKNNPNFDVEACEKEIREAYAQENPEYAQVAEEGKAVQEKFDEAMDIETKNYYEQNPQPSAENFATQEEYENAMNQWNDDFETHMMRATYKYAEENPDYKHLQDIKMYESLKDMPSEVPSDFGTTVAVYEPDSNEATEPIASGSRTLESIYRDHELNKTINPDGKEADLNEIKAAIRKNIDPIGSGVVNKEKVQELKEKIKEVIQNFFSMFKNDN